MVFTPAVGGKKMNVSQVSYGVAGIFFFSPNGDRTGTTSLTSAVFPPPFSFGCNIPASLEQGKCFPTMEHKDLISLQ